MIDYVHLVRMSTAAKRGFSLGLLGINTYSSSKKKVVFYGQDPRSGESTNTECGVSFQLLAVIY